MESSYDHSSIFVVSLICSEFVHFDTGLILPVNFSCFLSLLWKELANQKKKKGARRNVRFF